MSNDYIARYGRVISTTVWIVECIGIFLFSLVSDVMPTIYAPIISVLMIVGLILLSYTVKLSNDDSRSCFLMFAVLSTIAVYFAAIAIGGAFLMCMLFIMQWLIVIFYFDKPLCLVLAAIQFFTMFALLIPSLIVPDRYAVVNIRQLGLALVSITLCAWIATNLIGVLTRQQQQNIDQKKSLDDMLRVVEIICNDAKESTEQKTDFIARISKDIKKLGKNINSSAQQELANIADEITTYTKLEKKEIFFSDRKYDFGKLLETIILNRRSEIQKKGLEYKINIGKNVPRFLIGDPEYVGRMIAELLDNAVSYTQRGSISLSIVMSENQIEIYISDTGRGVRKKNMDNIFSPFFSEDESDEDGIGTGLGLFISKQLAGLMGGDLTLASEYGKGTKVYLRFLQECETKQVGDTKQESLYEYMNSVINKLSVNNQSVDNQLAEKQLENGSIQLLSVPGIDWDVAHEYLPNKEIVESTLSEFYKAGYGNADKLRSIWSDSTPEEFRVKIHAIKSNLRMIGAVELAGKAERLEYAVRDGKTGIINDELEQFLREYVELVDTVGKLPGVE